VAIASARAGNVIGGGDWGKDRLIPDCMIKWMQKETVYLRYPQSIRPWQHVLEPLHGYLMLAEKLYDQGQLFSEAFNFGPNDAEARPVQYVVDRLASHWGEDARWTIDQQEQPHEAHYLKLDCSKATIKLGWKPKWNLDKTLELIIEWYRAFKRSPETVQRNTLSQIERYSMD
jgi:CDP-glucose 4,6-dehydratase